MDWNAAIEKNREALKRVLSALVAMAGLRGQFTFFLQEGASPQDETLADKSKLSPALALPRRLHRAVLRLLRPAESAARRLVIVAALGLAIASPPRQTRKPTPLIPSSLRSPPGCRTPATLALPLFDPPRRLPRPRPPTTSGVPRISFPGAGAPFPLPIRGLPSRNDPIDATRLALRLAALASALDDLPAQARRFARWQARRGSSGQRGFVSRLWPLRLGRPPGQIRKPTHEVHAILATAHGLAFWALEQPRLDTS